MKAKRMLITYLLLMWPILAFCLALIIPGKVSIEYSGFAVDSAGVLYVGKNTAIEKYDNEKMIGTINPKTSRAYVFTIQNDKILLSTSAVVYTLDLSGNTIEEHADVGTRMFNELQKTKNRYITQSNREYTMKSHFGRAIIYSGKEIVYQMPILDYIVKILFFAVIMSVLVVTPIIVKKGRKEGTSWIAS